MNILIDSGMDLRNEILDKLNELNVRKIDLLINTHCHYDHIANNSKLKKKFNLNIAMHEKDVYAVKNIKGSTYSSFFNSDFNSEIDSGSFDFDVIFKGGEKIKLKDHTLEVIHTPGHTEGSICIYDRETKSLFSGDTIFAEGFGRTDLLGGSYDNLKNSIRILNKLNESFGIKKVYPGHGDVFDFHPISLNFFFL